MRDLYEAAAREGRAAWFIVFMALLALGGALAIGSVSGCYPRPPGPIPTCAEDPTQEWCVPPAFLPRRDGGTAGCRRIVWRSGKVVMSCDDHEPVADGVDMVVDATGRSWSACAWNSCGRDPNCRARLFHRDDGGAR